MQERQTVILISKYLGTYSVHSFNAVSNLLMVWEFMSIIAAAVGEESLISDKAATALATTYKSQNKSLLLNIMFSVASTLCIIIGYNVSS